jgi:hypothetical protein
VAPRGRVGQEHADLTVLDPPSGATILTLHTHALLTLLEEAGLIDNQHAVRIGQVLLHIRLQIVPHRVGLPDRSS